MIDSNSTASDEREVDGLNVWSSFNGNGLLAEMSVK